MKCTALPYTIRLKPEKRRQRVSLALHVRVLASVAHFRAILIVRSQFTARWHEDAAHDAQDPRTVFLLESKSELYKTYGNDVDAVRGAASCVSCTGTSGLQTEPS